MTHIYPFLKWAGGKRWLVSGHACSFPQKFKRYIEPFLGSGAVFFHLRPRSAILADTNADLINAYKAIKKDWALVASKLAVHSKRHCSEYYYAMREKACRDPADRAAQFIYLNRTCWNALYRVNRNGKFNVPIGTKNSVLLPTDNFEGIAKLLRRARIVESDFENVIQQAECGDLIFCDPPYTVKHNYNGFIKYNERLFSWSDQIRLRDCLVAARERGASFILTNANHSSVIELYRDVGEQIVLERSSVIAGDKKYRGQFRELLVRWV